MGATSAAHAAFTKIWIRRPVKLWAMIRCRGPSICQPRFAGSGKPKPPTRISRIIRCTIYVACMHMSSGGKHGLIGGADLHIADEAVYVRLLTTRGGDAGIHHRLRRERWHDPAPR